MESEDWEEIMGDPVWKVEDRDLGMMDLERELSIIEIFMIFN